MKSPWLVTRIVLPVFVSVGLIACDGSATGVEPSPDSESTSEPSEGMTLTVGDEAKVQTPDLTKKQMLGLDPALSKTDRSGSKMEKKLSRPSSSFSMEFQVKESPEKQVVETTFDSAPQSLRRADPEGDVRPKAKNRRLTPEGFSFTVNRERRTVSFPDHLEKKVKEEFEANATEVQEPNPEASSSLLEQLREHGARIQKKAGGKTVAIDEMKGGRKMRHVIDREEGKILESQILSEDGRVLTEVTPPRPSTLLSSE